MKLQKLADEDVIIIDVSLPTSMYGDPKMKSIMKCIYQILKRLLKEDGVIWK